MSEVLSLVEGRRNCKLSLVEGRWECDLSLLPLDGLMADRRGTPTGFDPCPLLDGDRVGYVGVVLIPASRLCAKR